MNDPAIRAEFERYLDRLAQVARDADDVIGLVGMGSTADLSRVDEWSDHDFAWMVRPGAQDRYRYDLSWLPDADRVYQVQRIPTSGTEAGRRYGQSAFVAASALPPQFPEIERFGERLLPEHSLGEG